MNILERLADEAKKKKQQFEQAVMVKPRVVQTTSPEVQAKLASATYGVLAKNPSQRQAFASSLKQPSAAQRFNPAKEIIPTAIQSAPKAAEGFGYGLGRSVVGTGQALSGLVDLASKGTGTSRVSKLLDKGAQAIDRQANRRGVSPAYKVGQLTGDTAQFFTPGLYLKGAAEVSKAGKAAKIVGNLAKYDKVVNKIQFANNLPGRAATVAARSSLGSSGALNTAAGTLLDTGANASKGRDTSPLSVGTSVALNAGFNAMPALSAQAGRELKAGAKATGAARRAALDYQKQVDSYRSNTRNLDKRIAFAKSQLDALPPSPTNARAVNEYMKKIDAWEAEKASIPKPVVRKMSQKFIDKVVTAQPGLSMKAVHSSDLTPEQNKSIEEYATFLKQMGQGNGVDIHPDGRRLSNNYRVPGMGSERKTNADWFDQARKDLESGKADSFAVDEYRKLGKATRPNDKLQTAIEQAHNTGNKQLEAQLVAKLPDQAMNPNATISPERRAELMAKMRKPSGTAPTSTVNKQPINRPPEAEEARIKMDNAFKEVNDEAAKTGTVNAQKWREANRLADEYWKTRDALDAKTAPSTTPAPQSPRVAVPAQPPQVPTRPVDSPLPNDTPKMSKRIRQAEDDFANGKISPAQLEKIRAEDSAGVQPKTDLQKKDIGLDEVTYSTGSKKPPIKDRFEQTKLDIRKNVFNRYAPIEDLAKGRNLRPSQNPATLLKRYSGGMGIANDKIDNELTPIIRQTKNYDDLRKFLIAERNNELNARNLNAPRADKALEELRTKVGDQEFANFQKVANDLYAYQGKMLKELHDLGGISKEGYEAIVKNNQKYIPFNRVLDDMEAQGFLAKANDVNSRDNGIRAIKGSERDIIDPIESMIKNTYDMTKTIEKQRVMKAMAELGEFSRVKGPGGPFEPKTPHITVLENGKKTYYTTSKDIADAIAGIDEESLNAAVRIAALPARALRAGATSLNVGFAVPNIIRDQLSAAVNSKYGGIPIYDWVNGLSSVIKKDDSYRRWIQSGADQASFFSQDRTTLRKGVADVTGEHKISHRAGQLVKSPLELARIMGEFSEKGTRVGTFKRASRGAAKEGLTGADRDLAAMVESRESSVDFARHGSKMRAANALIPFLNARTQGSLKFIQSARKRPAQTGMIGMALAGVPAALIYAHNAQYEDYKEVPDYIKDNNFVIMMGNEKVPFIKIPKGEVGKIFGGPVEAFLDFASKQDGKNPIDLAKDIAATLSPLSSGMDAIPTAAKVPLEVATNYDTFRGRNIVSPFKKDLPKELQDNNDTSETFKAIGNLTKQSPAKMEHAFRGVTAGVGKQVTQATDALFFGNKPKGPDLPVVDRFAGEGKDLRKSADELYKKLDQASAVRARENYAIKQALEKGDSSVLDGISKQRASSLERTVRDDKILEGLTPKQKALYNASGEQLEQLKSDSSLKKDIEFVENIKESNSKKTADKSFDEQLMDARKNYAKKKSDMTRFQRYKAEDEIKNLEVKKNYTKGVVGLYGASMSKQEVYDYLSTDPDGKRVAHDLLAYGDALVAAGLTTKNKFRDSKGNVAIRPKETGSGGSSRGIKPSDFVTPFDTLVKTRTKGAALARNAKLAKRTA